MSATNQTLERLLLVEGIVIVVVLVLVGGFALVVVRVGLLPLDRMGHTAAAIAGGDLSHRVETTDQRTEVGRLGLALNRMLDRLEDAFAAREASQERLRRFIADASHELRTPLVSIRGYAELFRMGAAREPEDVAKAMRRIEDEAARMGVLVEDLLTLARLDELREAPHGAVDLSRARPRRRRRRARHRARARDRRCDAAPARTSPATPTSCARCSPTCCATRSCTRPRARRSRSRCERENGAVRLQVRDHGPGLPTDDADALFERFWRAEGGRERGKDGAGLGLAIVAGIVDGHAGTRLGRERPGRRRRVRGPASRPDLDARGLPNRERRDTMGSRSRAGPLPASVPTRDRVVEGDLTSSRTPAPAREHDNFSRFVPSPVARSS